MPTTIYSDDQLKTMYLAINGPMRKYIREPPRKVVTMRERQTLPGLLGEFAVRNTTLGIARIYFKDGVLDCFRELCTLSHELGHARSWLDGNHTPAYQNMLDHRTPLHTLDPAMMQFVMQEEIRAWRTGWKLVQFVGMGDKGAYQAEADTALQIYSGQMSLAHARFEI